MACHLQKHQLQCPPSVSLPTHHRIRLCEANIEWSIWFTLLIKDGYGKIYVRDITVLQIFQFFWNFLKPYEKTFLIKCKIRVYFITDIIFVIILLSSSLTRSFLIHLFSIPWKHQKTLRIENEWINITFSIIFLFYYLLSHIYDYLLTYYLLSPSQV